MERQEIEAELNEVERDLADIARRAHIAASNLRSVADAVMCEKRAFALFLNKHARSLDGIRANAHETKCALMDTKPATVAAGEGGAE